MIPLSPAPLALSSEEIIARFGPNISTLIKNEIAADVDPEKIYQFSKALRLDLMYRGLTHLFEDMGEGGVVTYRPITGSSQMEVAAGGASSNSAGTYDYNLNMLRGDIRKIVAVLGQRAPNLQAMPRISGVESQEAMCRIANKAASFFRSSWNIEALHRYLSLSLCKNGTTFSHVTFHADKHKYGESRVDYLDMVETPTTEQVYNCAGCGSTTPSTEVEGLVQQLGGVTRCPKCERPLGPESLQEFESTHWEVSQRQSTPYANGSVEIELTSILTTSTPFHIRSLDDAPWLRYRRLEHSGRLIRAYPEHLRQFAGQQVHVRGAVGYATEAEYQTQESVNSTVGFPMTNRRNRWLFEQTWVRPEMIELLPNDRSGEARDILSKQYPDGLKTVLVNGKVCAIKKEDHRAHWSACMPEPAETLYADPIFEDYAHAQIIVRDLYNMLVMQEERAVGHVFFNPDYVSPQVLRTRPPEPGSYIPARGGSGEDLSRAFFKGPSADGDRQMNDHIDKHISRARENVGATPAIWGGGGPEPTARATEIKKNQALQQLNTTWNEMRRFWEDTTYKATMIMAELSGGKFYFPRAGGVLEMVEINNVWKLREGGWRFHAEESFPLTAGQRRDVLMQLLGMPAVHTLLGFGPPVPLSMVNPAAIERIQEAVGLPDLETPGKSEKLRLLGIIAKLRELPMQIDPMTGMPAPAVLPDTMLFDAQFAVRVIKDWMLGESGVAAEENDQEWYEHVRMFMQSWQMVLQQQIMAAQQQAMIAAGADADSGAAADGEGKGLNQSPPSPGVESDPLAGSQPPAGDGSINPPPQLAIQ